MSIKDYFKKYTRKSQKGFTLVEMIAVVAILAITSTATLSIFLAVKQTCDQTRTIATEQVNTSQIEKFIRNQFQTASKIDIVPHSSGIVLAPTRDIVQDDEYMFYDSDNKCIYFVRYDDPTTTRTVLTLDNVSDVTLTFCPLDYTTHDSGTAPDNMPFKLIYKIVTENYTYSGGIVLGNTQLKEDDNFQIYNATTFEEQNVVQIVWNESSIQNSECVIFHTSMAETTDI